MSAAAELASRLAEPAPGPSALDLPHGIHDRVPEDLYHRKVPGLASKHVLDLIHRAPAAYLAWLQEQDDAPTPAMVFGKDFHTACLEPHLYRPTLSTKSARENAERIAGMVEAVRSHPVAGPLVARGRPEVTARWQDPVTGIECKARADLYVPEYATIADLKSCSDASPEEFARSVAKFAYHAQDALYRDAFELAGGPRVDNFVFVAVEKTPPYLVAVYVLDESAVDRGRRRNNRALARFAQCIEKDDWPGLPTAIQTIDLPKWAQD